MFTGEDFNTSQQFSARNSPYLDHMALLQLRQNRNLPSYPYPIFASQIALTGQPTYDSHCPNTAQQTGLGRGLLKPRPPPNHSGIPSIKDLISYDSPCPNTTQQTLLCGGLLKPQPPPCYSGIPFIKSDLPSGFGLSNKPNDLPPQKRYLIFDHSEDRMRLFYGPSLIPHLDQTITSKNPADGPVKKVEAQMDQHFLVNEENWDENNLIGEEGEMREDTEEINALLYSDSIDDDRDSDDDDDEVISPIHDLSLSKDKDRDEDDIIEEVASSDGTCKRQRLLDGSYKRSSYVSIGTVMKRPASSCTSQDDVESKCLLAENSCNNEADSLNREKKVKIHKALHVLSRMIPGLKNKNPLSIIDNSIVYLESLKVEAEALRLSCYTESKLHTSP